jgi:hypothetical protein
VPYQLKKPVPGAVLKERRSFSHSEGNFSSPESIRTKVLNEKRSSVNKLPLKNMKQDILKRLSLQRKDDGSVGLEVIEKCQLNIKTDILKQNEMVSRLEYMT